MRDTNDADEAVRARLRAVLGVDDDQGVRGQPAPPAAAAVPAPASGPSRAVPSPADPVSVDPVPRASAPGRSSLDGSSLDGSSLSGPSFGGPSLGGPSLGRPYLGRPSMGGPSFGGPGSGAADPDEGWPPVDEMPLTAVTPPVDGDQPSGSAARVPPWERHLSGPVPRRGVGAPPPVGPRLSARALTGSGGSDGRPAATVASGTPMSPADVPAPPRDVVSPVTGRAGLDDPAGRLSGIGAFDPGRRGAKALAAVAAVVVLVAAVLAWRARPHVEPVPPVPVAEAADVPADPTGGPAARAPGPAATGEVVVAVAGKVHRPGLVRLPPGSRVADALQAAGGADTGVDVALLNLARKVVDGELILVGVTPPPGTAVAGAAGSPAAGGAAPAAGPVNLNTATLADLDTLPGVGPVLAQRIIDHRDQQGGFRAVGDLRKVEGIGSSRYEQLKDLVTV